MQRQQPVELRRCVVLIRPRHHQKHFNSSFCPSLQDQAETQATEAAWGPRWLQRPFLPQAAAGPGKKPPGLTFRGPPPAASVLIPTSCWGWFGQSLSPSSPCCGGSRCPGSRKLLCSTLCPAHRPSEFVEDFAEPELPGTAN